MTLQIENLHAQPGQKTRGYISVDVGIASVRLPIVLINGSQPGPRLTVTAGIHHGEFIGIEALRNFTRDLDPTQLRGQIVACLLASPPAFYAQRGGLSPLDEINPNRVFPGNATGRPTERLAHWLYTHLMANADAYIDLHGAQSTESMTPFAAYRSSGNEALDQRTLALAHAFGWTDIVRGASAGGGNTHASTTRAGIPSLLIEIGSRASRSPDEIAAVIAGLDSVCAHLGMRDGTGAAEPVDFKHWVWAAEVEAELDGLWYPEFKMGDHVRRGDTLGRIIDPLDNELARITSPSDGKAFYGEWGLVAMVGGVLAAIAISED